MHSINFAQIKRHNNDCFSDYFEKNETFRFISFEKMFGKTFLHLFGIFFACFGSFFIENFHFKLNENSFEKEENCFLSLYLWSADCPSSLLIVGPNSMEM